MVEAKVKIVIKFEIIRKETREIYAKGKGEQVAVKFPEYEFLYEIPDDVRITLGF